MNNMEDLTFGEQVKIVLGRKGMTIKELAETIEARTGRKMSRQNLTQRLGRDNFQEQDMRMIASILGCPFQLSILGGDSQTSAAYAESAAAYSGKIENVSQEVQKKAEDQPVQLELDLEPAQSVDTEEDLQADNIEEAEFQKEQTVYEEAQEEPSEEIAPLEEPVQPESVQQEEIPERDMTIGELYEIHEELAELEENARAGEPVEVIKEELEKPKRERFRPANLFLRRRKTEEKQTVKPAEEPALQPEPELQPQMQSEPEADLEYTAPGTEQPQEQEYAEPVREEPERERSFEPVISHEDAEEDREKGEVNPYTGREYQSNSVRMHPTRIGYVQVYDRTIHKWTDMTEWAFLGYQERKKALLGKAYEPPIYLD